jgi:hypothetical protein
MARKLADPSKRKWVGRAYWTAHKLRWSSKDGLHVESNGNQRIRVAWLFFVWRPDVVKQWPGLLGDDSEWSEEPRGRDPKYTPTELAALQQAYRNYKREHPDALVKDADAHLAGCSSRWFKKSAHTDTIRDMVRKPVDEADALLEK